MIFKSTKMKNLNKNLGKSQLYTGFTLSEVLITLGIIGVLAAMTIPTVLQNQREKETVVKLKKAYSTLSNAYTLAVQENGTPENWEMADKANMFSKLVPYLNIVKDCSDGRKGCWPTGTMYKYLNGDNNEIFDNSGTFAKIKLTNGFLLLGWVINAQCSLSYGTTSALNSVCGRYWVDINGDKGPNTRGKDMFAFWLTKNGIIPLGTQRQNAEAMFNNECNTSSSGTGCAAWVIYNENMDYLHCSDLSWTGKTQCD